MQFKYLIGIFMVSLAATAEMAPVRPEASANFFALLNAQSAKNLREATLQDLPSGNSRLKRLQASLGDEGRLEILCGQELEAGNVIERCQLSVNEGAVYTFYGQNRDSIALNWSWRAGNIPNRTSEFLSCTFQRNVRCPFVIFITKDREGRIDGGEVRILPIVQR